MPREEKGLDRFLVLKDFKVWKITRFVVGKSLQRNDVFTRRVIKFEFKEISFMEKMVKSPTWLEEFIKLGRGRQRHT